MENTTALGTALGIENYWNTGCKDFFFNLVLFDNFTSLTYNDF